MRAEQLFLCGLAGGILPGRLWRCYWLGHWPIVSQTAVALFPDAALRMAGFGQQPGDRRDCVFGRPCDTRFRASQGASA